MNVDAVKDKLSLDEELFRIDVGASARRVLGVFPMPHQAYFAELTSQAMAGRGATNDYAARSAECLYKIVAAARLLPPPVGLHLTGAALA